MKKYWPEFIKYFNLLAPIVFFIGLFFVVMLPLRDFDIWFHLKSGEIIAQKGIIHYDVFSYRTQGREWFPYEWLFQVTVYYWKYLFGFESIKYLIAAFVVLMNVIVYFMMRRFFKLNVLLSLFLCFIFTASNYEFFTARPQAFAYTFLLANLFFILLYYFKGKNLLWATLPITLAWANLHGSIFIDVGFFIGYTVVCFANYFLLKEKIWVEKGKTLGIYTLATSVLTVLPPLGILQYRLLVEFFFQREVISRFVAEWVPLIYYGSTELYIYTATVILVLVAMIGKLILERSWKHNLWIIPLLPFIFLAYTANRNVFLAYISMVLIVGWIFSKLKISTLFMSVCIVLLGLHIFVLHDKRENLLSLRLYYPINATQFIKEHMNGNMFNEYGYGGYMLYQLYPEKKVFFDGRTDLYVCCEIPYLTHVTVQKNLPDTQYKTILDKMWDKYNISYVVMRTEKNSLQRKIARILTDDPNWSLVFWDDHSEIFARHDGKNNEVINQYGAKYVTPYDRNPYRPGKENLALNEYERMIAITDSAKSRNAIGYIDLKKGLLDQAQQEFDKAVQLDPTFESPYMNLAELAAHDNQLDHAIALYQAAKNLAPDRGLIYIRLGQLMLQRGDDPQEVKKIWLEGIKQTIDTDARTQLQKMLANL